MTFKRSKIKRSDMKKTIEQEANEATFDKIAADHANSTSSNHQERSMKWIKASERLPNEKQIGDYFNLQFDDVPAVGRFIRLHDKLTFQIDKYGIVDQDKLHAVCWLEIIESLPQSNNKGMEFYRKELAMKHSDEIIENMPDGTTEELIQADFKAGWDAAMKYHNQFHNKEEVSENELLDEIEEKLSIQLSRGHGLVANIIQLLKQHYSITKK